MTAAEMIEHLGQFEPTAHVAVLLANGAEWYVDPAKYGDVRYEGDDGPEVDLILLKMVKPVVGDDGRVAKPPKAQSQKSRPAG